MEKQFNNIFCVIFGILKYFLFFFFYLLPYIYRHIWRCRKVFQSFATSVSFRVGFSSSLALCFFLSCPLRDIDVSFLYFCLFTSWSICIFSLCCGERRAETDYIPYLFLFYVFYSLKRCMYYIKSHAIYYIWLLYA